MTTWFTADTHLGHANIIEYCDRPYSTVEDMDRTIIENWNQAVQPSDTVYHLGDFTLGGPEIAASYFAQLHGNIFIVPGGHDKRWLGKREYVSNSGDPVNILPALTSIKLPIPGTEIIQVIVLCHYSMRVWDRSHYGTWQLYGHSHCSLPPLRNSLDVGVDCWDYRPISIETVHRSIEQQNHFN